MKRIIIIEHYITDVMSESKEIFYDDNPDFSTKVKKLKLERAKNIIQSSKTEKLTPYQGDTTNLISGENKLDGNMKDLLKLIDKIPKTIQSSNNSEHNTQAIKEKGPEDEAIDYFSKVDINAHSVNQFLISQGKRENTLVPEFLFQKNKLQIIQDLKQQGNIVSPMDAATRISNYIKSNLKYSGTDFLQQVDGMRKDLTNLSKLSLTEFIAKVYSPTNVLITKKQFKALEKITSKTLKELKKIPKNTHETIDISNHCSIINQITKKSDPDKLTDEEKAMLCTSYTYLSGLKGESIILQPMLQETKDIMLTGIYEVSDMLQKMKVGVCRHFSMIAKELYQELIKNTEFEKNSELLYVLGSKKTHARNLLFRQDQDGTLQKQYFDLTRYIFGGNLEGTSEVENEEEGEFWVNNTKTNANIEKNTQTA